MIKDNRKTKKKGLIFYLCTVCGNLIVKLIDSGLTPQCCGRDMVELVPASSDGAVEKHVPAWKMDGCKLIVQVGEEMHPMSESHYIQWICVSTSQGFRLRNLDPDEAPCAEFKLNKGEIVDTIYAYCNMHGLWMVNVDTGCHELGMDSNNASEQHSN